MTSFVSGIINSTDKPSCPACLRLNAPTRTACLYCGALLPIVDASIQRPAFRRMEEWEAGYNVICFPNPDFDPQIEAASAWLHLPAELLNLAVSCNTPAPLARLATADEALLTCQNLQSFGFDVGFIPDRELLVQEFPPQRIRSLEDNKSTIAVEPIGGNPPFSVKWEEIRLFVRGRLFTKQATTEERAKGRREQEVVDSSETGSDELVLDVYTANLSQSWRIQTSGFDFSCLGTAKELLSGNNFARLCTELAACAPKAAWQNSYDSLKPLLAEVWPPVKQTDSSGWQRTRGSSRIRRTITTSKYENQFTRYSRLCYQLALNDEESSQ